MNDETGTLSQAEYNAQLEKIKSLIQAGRFADAEQLASDLADNVPDGSFAIEAYYMLAVARRYQHNYDGALAATADLIDTKPDHGRAYQERAYNLLSLNRLSEAANAFSKAVELNPGLLASWQTLVNLQAKAGRTKQARYAAAQVAYLEALPRELLGVIDLIHEGKLYKAENLCRHFLINNKHHTEAMRLLADIGVRLRILDDAEFLLESCVELEPENLRTRSDYLKVLNRKCRFDKALEQAGYLLRAQPDNPVFQLAMANAQTGLGYFEQGIAGYRSCLERSGNKPGVYMLLGHAQKATGDFDGAVESYREASRLQPGYGDAYWSLANTKTYRFSSGEIDRICSFESDKMLSVEDHTHLCFAAGKAFEDQGEYEASFSYYQKGNALKNKSSGYDPDKTSEMISAQIETCTSDLFADRGHFGCQDPDPIFIVGLPRSGSTLLEQILASHSMVDGTMELHNILGFAQRLRGRAAETSSNYPAILSSLEETYFNRFGEKFIQDTRVYRDNAPYFIDKMPNNFMHIGLIRLILPRAKIIDARRHPMACCFSGFKQLFGEGQDFTYSLESMGRYYADYIRLMEHWDTVLPGNILKVQYEDVVLDLETQVKRLLEFCGLPFEENCLKFHKTKRSVRTPSSEQVRQPIYFDGMDYWRNFDPWLNPLREALGPDVRQRYDIKTIQS